MMLHKLSVMGNTGTVEDNDCVPEQDIVAELEWTLSKAKVGDTIILVIETVEAGP